MFGIANYVFIILGLLLIVGSVWDYKVFNPLAWGDTRKKTGIFKKISPAMFKLNKLGDYWDGLFGFILCLIGLYGMINNIHDEGEEDLGDTIHRIFEDKGERDDAN